ncbi:portal protein [Acetobacter sp. UBA5411]|uniref:portal protein n=1 Tax=Acetobacter sp. UBA5411 TaxID=1945905 RepID=UPI0025C0CA5A|nr:hypothetical protein [Acetobacter sp. UBA5411]
MAKSSALSNEDVATLIRQRIDASIIGTESVLAKGRLHAARYYAGQEPRPMHNGNNSFVSRDVFDAVESRKAALLETFTGNVRPIRFAPQNDADVQEATQATLYTDYAVFRQNKGFQIMHDVIHDGLMARVGLVQVWWQKDVQTVPYVLRDLDPNAAGLKIQELSRTANISDVEVKADPDTELVTVSYNQQEDNSRASIEPVPPEEFGISSRAISMDTADIVYRRQMKTKADLLEDGYDKEALDEIQEFTDDFLAYDPEVSERFFSVETGIADQTSQDQGLKKISVFDCYGRFDGDGNGQQDLWHVVLAGTATVLKMEKVSRHPFHAYVPMRVPHRFYGDCFASHVAPIQMVKTLLTRTVVDHSLITNNPRYQVMRGALVNPRELIENRIGGIVNVTRPDALAPLPQPSLNPYVFQTINAMDANKEAITGTTDLSQGINKDVISSQNSSDLVSQMATMGQTRAKMMARNFSDFLSELFVAVYQLIIENEQQQKVIDVCGTYVSVDPSSWKSRRDVSVTLAIGYGERDKETQQLFQMDQFLASQPGMSPIYTVTERFNAWKRMLENQGVYDVSNYLKNPATIPPPQPSAEQQQQADLAEREMQVKEQLAENQALKVNSDAQIKADQTQGKMQTIQAGQALKEQQADLRVLQFQHQVGLDAAEVALQHRAHDIAAQAKPVAVQPKD